MYWAAILQEALANPTRVLHPYRTAIGKLHGRALRRSVFSSPAAHIWDIGHSSSNAFISRTRTGRMLKSWPLRCRMIRPFSPSCSYKARYIHGWRPSAPRLQIQQQRIMEDAMVILYSCASIQQLRSCRWIANRQRKYQRAAYTERSSNLSVISSTATAITQHVWRFPKSDSSKAGKSPQQLPATLGAELGSILVLQIYINSSIRDEMYSYCSGEVAE